MHLARALKGRGEFQEALNVLDAAEEMSADQGRAIRVYKEEVVAAMKEHLRSFNKASKFCKENSIEEPEGEEIGRVENADLDTKSGTVLKKIFIKHLNMDISFYEK